MKLVLPAKTHWKQGIGRSIPLGEGIMLYIYTSLVRQNCGVMQYFFKLQRLTLNLAASLVPSFTCTRTCTFKPVLSCKCHSNNGKVEEHDVIWVEYEVEQSGYDGYAAQDAKNH